MGRNEKKKEKNIREGNESWSCAAFLPLPVGPDGPVDDDRDVPTSWSCSSL
jgi:hypothetical protein